jgi:hypothetical protein
MHLSCLPYMIHAIHHPILLDMITWRIFGELYRL